MIAWSAAPPCCGYLRSVPDIIEFFYLHRFAFLTIGYSVAPCHLLHCYTIMILLYSMLLGSVINNWLKPRNFPLGRGWCNSFTPTFTTHTLSTCVTPTLIYITSILSNERSLLPSLNEKLLHTGLLQCCNCYHTPAIGVALSMIPPTPFTPP